MKTYHNEKKKFIYYIIMLMMLCLTCLVVFKGNVFAQGKRTYGNYEEIKVEASSTELGINGIKTLNGRHFKQGDYFKFEIRNSANAPAWQNLPDKTICEIKPTSGNTANIEFGTFTFEQSGTYIYVISEQHPQEAGTEIIPGITYDTTGYRLTIKVNTNVQTNQLEIKNIKIEKSLRQEVGTWTELYNGSQFPKQQYCNFTNTYTPLEQTVSLTGTKVLKNKKLSDYGKEQFKFILEAVGKKTADGNYKKDPTQPMPANSFDGVCTFKNLATGGIIIPGNTFTRNHVGIEYRYIITEWQPTNTGKYDGTPLDGAVKNNNGKWVYKGIVFDNHIHTVDMKAELVNEGNQEEIKVAISHDEHGANAAMRNFIFTNEYYASTSLNLMGTKILTGRNFVNGDTFTFNITPIANAPKPVDNLGNIVSQVNISPTNKNRASINFGTLKFDISNMDGQNEKIFEYKLTEQTGTIVGMTYDTHEKIVRIKVTNDGAGNMVSKVISDENSLKWINQYHASYSTKKPNDKLETDVIGDMVEKSDTLKENTNPSNDILKENSSLSNDVSKEKVKTLDEQEIVRYSGIGFISLLALYLLRKKNLVKSKEAVTK